MDNLGQEFSFSFEKIFRAARCGDREAQGVLLGRLRPQAIRAIRLFMGATAERRGSAEDIFQDVSYEFLCRLDRYRTDFTEHELRSLLISRAQKRVLDSVKKKREGGESDLPSGRPINRDISTGEVTAADDIRWMRMKIDALPESFRQILLMSTVDELTVTEIALKLGIEVGSARKRLARAKRRMKENGGSNEHA